MQTPSPIPFDAILFDLDGTLHHANPSGSQVFRQFAEELGVQADPSAQREAERWAHSYWASSAELREDVELAGREREGLWLRYTTRYLMRLGVDETQIELIAERLMIRMVEEYSPQDVVPEDVPETLGLLRNQGFRLAVLSNRENPLADSLAEMGLADNFEYALAAGEVGYWKPDPRIFEFMLGKMAVEAERAVYVGDNYYADVLGARNAGVFPVLIDPRGLFHEADCTVIATMAELPDVLESEWDKSDTPRRPNVD